MRYVTAAYHPPSGRAFHAVGQSLADADAVTREYVHRTGQSDDGTVASLLSVRGDAAVAEAVLRNEPTVVDVAVADAPDCGALVFVRYEPNDLVESMLSARNNAPIVMDMPIVVRDSGAYEVTYLGSHEAFADSLGTVPNVEPEVLETGSYTPCRRDAFDCLTDRQSEVVVAAVELGYYRNPREATQQDVADHIGCSPGNVGEHLRKAEERVFSQFVSGE